MIGQTRQGVSRFAVAIIVVAIVVLAGIAASSYLMGARTPGTSSTTIGVTSASMAVSNSGPSGKFPLWTFATSGTINSLSVSENGSYVAVGEGFNDSGGAILLLNKTGSLLWEHQTDRIIEDVAISDNGSRILANGFQILPGIAAVFANSEVYALDSKGGLLWSRNSSFPYDGAISADGSRVAIFSQGFVALLTWSGQVLWNNTAEGALCPVLGPLLGPCPILVSPDGRVVASGLHGITLFGSNGTDVWTNTEANNIWTQSVALPPGGDQIAGGFDFNGLNGTVLLLTGQGGLLWEHHLDSEVDSAAVLQDGSTVGYVTDSNVLFYNRTGALIANFTNDRSTTLLPTANGLFLLGGGWEGGNNPVLFNSTGGLVRSFLIPSVVTDGLRRWRLCSGGVGGLWRDSTGFSQHTLLLQRGTITWRFLLDRKQTLPTIAQYAGESPAEAQ
jgi:PQQ-like domain